MTANNCDRYIGCPICGMAGPHKMDCPNRRAPADDSGFNESIDKVRTLLALETENSQLKREVENLRESEAGLLARIERLKGGSEGNYYTIAQMSESEAKAWGLVERLRLSSQRSRTAKLDVDALIPEQDTEWPDGYDFSELEAAQNEESAASNELDTLWAESDAALAARKAGQ